MSEEGTRKHKFEGTKNDEGHSVTEPSVIPTVVRVVPPMVHVVKQIVAVPHMTFPHERQPKEQR
jgi:hypothetical protein